MRYGPQDWDLVPGIYNHGADPRVWIHKACGERLEFPDDNHRCRDEADTAAPSAGQGASE